MSVTATTTGMAWQDGGENSSKAFVVTRRLVSTTTLDLTNSGNAATLRTAASAVPMTAYTGTFNTSDMYGPYRVRSCQLVPVAGSENKVFDAVVTYGTRYYWANYYSQYILPVEVSYVAGERTTPLYRSGFATSPAADLNSAGDIGGTSRDTAGVPVEGRVHVNEIRIGIEFDSITDTLNVAYDAVTTARGRWNSDSFLWWSANQVYCVSADIVHVQDEIYKANFVFKWDGWFACDQHPDRDNDNYVKLNASGQASTVRWRSTPRGTAAMTPIFDLAPNSTAAAQIAKEGTWVTAP